MDCTDTDTEEDALLTEAEASSHLCFSLLDPVVLSLSLKTKGVKRGTCPTGNPSSRSVMLQICRRVSLVHHPKLPCRRLWHVLLSVSHAILPAAAAKQPLAQSRQSMRSACLPVCFLVEADSHSPFPYSLPLTFAEIPCLSVRPQ